LLGRSVYSYQRLSLLPANRRERHALLRRIARLDGGRCAQRHGSFG
jgi:hypothetical protein